MSKRRRPPAQRAVPALNRDLWGEIYGHAVALGPYTVLALMASHRDALQWMAAPLSAKLREYGGPADDETEDVWQRRINVALNWHVVRSAAWYTLMRLGKGELPPPLMRDLVRLLCVARQHRRYATVVHEGHRLTAHCAAGVPLCQALKENGSFRHHYYVTRDAQGQRQAHPLIDYAGLRMQAPTGILTEGYGALTLEARATIDAMPDPLKRALCLQRWEEAGRRRWGLMCDLVGSERMPSAAMDADEQDYYLGVGLVDGAHFHSLLRPATLPYALYRIADREASPESYLAAALHFDAREQRHQLAKQMSHALKEAALVVGDGQLHRRSGVQLDAVPGRVVLVWTHAGVI